MLRGKDYKVFLYAAVHCGSAFYFWMLYTKNKNSLALVVHAFSSHWGRGRQVSGFEASQGYRMRPCLKKQSKTKIKNKVILVSFAPWNYRASVFCKEKSLKSMVQLHVSCFSIKQLSEYTNTDIKNLGQNYTNSFF